MSYSGSRSGASSGQHFLLQISYGLRGEGKKGNGGRGGEGGEGREGMEGG